MEMKDTQRQRWSLILIMMGVGLTMTLVSIFVLYQTAYEEERSRLVEVAQSQARLMEAVARFDMQYSHNYPEGTEAATLSQFIEAHKKFQGFGKTGEFLLARVKENQIVFILSHRHTDLMIPQSLPMDSPLGIPIQRALNGDSGTMVGPDYRNVNVLAAYEPIKILNLGLVAKIDLKEIRAPFYRAGLIAMGIGFAVITIGAILFWRVSNPLVREIASSREQLRNLAHRLQDIREEEKERIARAVHDELGQQLTAIQLELNFLEEEIEPKDKKHQLQESIHSMAHLIETTIKSVQRIATELRPQILDVFGLGQAILWQVQDYQPRTGMQFDCSGVDNEVTLDQDRSITIFRVFQETLTNIFRHAKASKVTIQLSQKNNLAVLKVSDNGIGIPAVKIKNPKSLGLLGIRERLLAWNGTVEIESQPGKGTTVTVQIPLGDLS
jgi:signal transduction histidine kinase